MGYRTVKWSARYVISRYASFYLRTVIAFCKIVLHLVRSVKVKSVSDEYGNRIIFMTDGVFCRDDGDFDGMFAFFKDFRKNKKEIVSR